MSSQLQRRNPAINLDNQNIKTVNVDSRKQFNTIIHQNSNRNSEDMYYTLNRVQQLEERVQKLEDQRPAKKRKIDENPFESYISTYQDTSLDLTSPPRKDYDSIMEKKIGNNTSYHRFHDKFKSRYPLIDEKIEFEINFRMKHSKVDKDNEKEYVYLLDVANSLYEYGLNKDEKEDSKNFLKLFLESSSIFKLSTKKKKQKDIIVRRS